MSEKILITGASGYVGAGLYRDLSEKGFEVYGTYHNFQLNNKLIHLDVTDEEEVKKVLTDISPDFVVHNAANASGAWCEENPEKAVELNERSTSLIAENFSKKIIFISSLAANYTDNVYGRTKKNSEQIILDHDGIVLRLSLVLGLSPNTKNDRPMNRILRVLDSGKEPVFDNSWEFYPTYLKHVSEVIYELISRKINCKKPIEVTADKSTTRAEIAGRILEEFNIKVKGEDQGRDKPLDDIDLSLLNDLNLPSYSYEEMIDGIKTELREWVEVNNI